MGLSKLSVSMLNIDQLLPMWAAASASCRSPLVSGTRWRTTLEKQPITMLVGVIRPVLIARVE